MIVWILASVDLTDDKGMNEIRKWTNQQEAAIQSLNAQESRCQTELNTAFEEYENLCALAANFDPNALWPERLRERENLTNEARTELKTRLGADYSERRLEFAEQRLREMLPEEGTGAAAVLEKSASAREATCFPKKPNRFPWEYYVPVQMGYEWRVAEGMEGNPK